uniref:Spectrin beta, non-erythrocytic 4 n=1 Tax=Buteo japonicus TaxID=224669 RepID=A0A8B9YYS8_9AVES
SWRDGLAFNALIHKHRPDLIDFHKLTKSNATYNLQQAFNTAEQQLGLSKLLDPEDVSMEDPDEKSIITYVVSFYHYFSKMKALAVEGKRIGKVLDQAMEIEAIIERYEVLAAELLTWIQHTITIISNQKFANSLTGVQQQLQAFTAFCILEKPINSMSPKGWGPPCRKAEHEREVSLRNELIRQEKRKELEDSRQLWAFFQEMEEAEAWIREKEQILAAKTCGRDLSSVLTLTNKHKSMLGELGSRRALLHQTMKRGEQILAKKRFSPGGIQEKMREVRLRWKKLEEVTGLHQQRLQEALNFFQFSTETDDLVAWLQDTYRIVSSDDFGHDDYSTQALLRKHRAVVEEVEKHQAAVLALRKQLALLAPEHRQGVDMQIRVVEVEQLYGEVAEVAVLRQQWLQDALAVYRMFSEVHACEVWVGEKEQWLERMEVPEELDEVEVVQHRFESLDQEMNSVMGRILDVNQVVQQLVDRGHPSSEEVRSCQDHLNSRYGWNRVVELVEHKKNQLSSVLKIQNYLLECSEMKAQVQEKRKAIEATQSGGSNLGDMLALQRRLSTMEAALVVLEPRLVELQREGEALAASHPGRALEILLPLEQISEEWEALKRVLQGCEDSLIIAGRLQQFIQDLDNFLSWLVKTQAAVASEEVPDSLAEAERLLNQHAALKEEINGYEEDYAKIQAASDLLALEETEVPYLSLQQWLQKLDAGWGKLLQSWETRREVLVQSHVFHLFLQDVQQCETSLYNQESTLVHAELPDTVEGVSNAIKKHKDFTTTMDLNLQKIQLALQAGESLQHQGNLYSDRVAEAMETHPGADSQLRFPGTAGTAGTTPPPCSGAGGPGEVGGCPLPSQSPVSHPGACPCPPPQTMESQVEEWYKEVGELQVQAAALPAQAAGRQAVGERQSAVGTRIVRLIEPLKERRRILLASKEVHQVSHELEDEVQTVENYEETIAQLSRQCRALLELGHPQSEQVSRRQSQVDRLYVSLKDLVEERKAKLEQQYWLYQLNREVDELEHWIAEKEVVAGSPELGQDFEHVTLLQEKFLEFASETGSVGQERITAVNQMVDELIDYGHTDAATIAEWKDGVNEAWADLLELMETRAQMLAASHELHKFFNDCKEVLGQIEEKRQRLPELAAREGRTSAGALQRALGAFEHDVEVLVTQVRQLQEGAAQLRTLYAGDNAEAIAGREQEVLRAWKELLAACEECRLHVASVADKIRFIGTMRDLLTWMDGVLCQIGTREKPRTTFWPIHGAKDPDPYRVPSMA